jgi:type III pantothenate kinase
MNPDKNADRYFVVIDQGNTFTKVALCKEKYILSTRQFNSFYRNDLIKFLDELSLDLESIDSGIVCSVSVDSNTITSLFPEIKWISFDENTPIPIVNDYHTKTTLGKDRLAGVVAASDKYPNRNVLVIDIGTAITYDVITSENKYPGGSISPGITIRFKALNSFTDRLPLIQPMEISVLTGIDTNSSILTGVMNGTMFEISGFISEYTQKYENLITLITGGDAKYFDKILKSNIFAFENLVLCGLNLILLYNLEKNR